MVRFKIVENSPPAYAEKYEEFIELYNNPDIIVEDIRLKLGWRTKIYNDARRQALKEGRIKDRRTRKMLKNRGRPRKPKYKPKYYTYDRRTRKYRVSKRYYVDGKYHITHYGGYRKETDAQKIVEELKKVGWDKSKLNEIKQRLNIWG